MKVLKEFRDFAVKGNVVDMAVGIIIGGAFGTIVKSMVDDVIMPPIGLALGGVDFKDLFILLRVPDGVDAATLKTLADAKAAKAVTMNIGLFVNAVISFTIVAFSVFMLVKGMNRMKRKEAPAPAAAPTTKDCAFCATAIPLQAKRCPHCTSQL